MLRVRKTARPREHEARLGSEYLLALAYVLEEEEVEKGMELLEQMVQIRMSMLPPEAATRVDSEDCLA